MAGRSSPETSPQDPGQGRVPAPLLRFLELYDRGDFWESHEVLEGPWRRSGSPFYQGLILYASAWVHWRRENAHGVHAQLTKTLDRLAGCPDAYLGIDVEGIREHCREVCEVVRRDDRWHERVAPLPLRLEDRRIRGDETESGG